MMILSLPRESTHIVDSCEKFAETQLPSISEFHNKLQNEPLSAEDYLRAQDSWDRFGCETLKDYHDHYLLTDVLLLADVFENFRKTVLKKHGFDPLHFITLPSLALKHTDTELDLITDPDGYLVLETNLRGGIVTISKRYASANNKHVEGYDDSEVSGDRVEL